jgi:hypothetical protein
MKRTRSVWGAAFQFAAISLLAAAVVVALSNPAFAQHGGGGGHSGGGHSGGGHVGGYSGGGGHVGAYGHPGPHPGYGPHPGGMWWHDHGGHWVGWWGGGPWWGWPGYLSIGFYSAVPYGYYYYDDGCGYYAADTAVAYTAAYPPNDTSTASGVTGEAPGGDASQPAYSGDSMGFYPQAVTAFQQGDYRNATRLAAHASIDDARNPDVHTLLMLGLFSVGEYRGAAMEAHAVISLGKTAPDWAKVFSYYGRVEPYTEHLRALEKFVRNNPKAPEGWFLLGFQYLMEGHAKEAQAQLLQAVKLSPRDRIAAQLLVQTGGTVPPEIAAQQQQQPSSLQTPALTAPMPPAPGNTSK